MGRDRAIFLGILAVAAAIGLSALLLHGRGGAEARQVNRPIRLDRDGYVSSSTCRACHPTQYASWHRSYHRTMTQIATPETVAASLSASPVDVDPGGPMVLESRDDGLWAEFDDPEGTRTRIRQHVVLTTG